MNLPPASLFVSIDLNCDMGEGIGHDADLMPLIDSANIACGFHAGDEDSMRHTIRLALAHGVRVGAHPSFDDRTHFGRRKVQLSATELYALVSEQLARINLVAQELGATLYHVKPHGALYNMAARDAGMARTIAQAVKDFRSDLVLYGLSGSCMITEATKLGLSTANEVFADRTYTDEGQLTPRHLPHALIEEEEASLRQVAQLLEGRVTTASGKVIPLDADTICLHGDGAHAVAFAHSIRQFLKNKTLAT